MNVTDFTARGVSGGSVSEAVEIRVACEFGGGITPSVAQKVSKSCRVRLGAKEWSLKGAPRERTHPFRCHSRNERQIRALDTEWNNQHEKLHSHVQGPLGLSDEALRPPLSLA